MQAIRTMTALAALLAFGGVAQAATEAEGLAEVKAFTLEHNAALIDEAKKMQATAEGYAAIIEAHGGDYARAWEAEGSKLATAVKDLRAHWLAASNQYETIEGIVAGIPSTAKYDLILDAGNPGTEAEDVAEYDLTLPDGTVLERPGSLFHSITEPPDGWVTAPNGAAARAEIAGDGAVSVTVRCGEVLDGVVVRSYCIGAAHMALGWVRSEGIAVGADGVPLDLTIRSFGVLRAVDTPVVQVAVDAGGGPPVNGSDAVFAAVALAAWRAAGFPPRWPTMQGV